MGLKPSKPALYFGLLSNLLNRNPLLAVLTILLFVNVCLFAIFWLMVIVNGLDDHIVFLFDSLFHITPILGFNQPGLYLVP